MRHTLLRTLISVLTGGLGLALAVPASAQVSFFSIPLDNPTPQIDALFGGAVAAAGDVNGDTVPDLLVGASFQDVGGNLDQGQAFVFSGADGSLLLTLDDPTPQQGARFGRGVAGVADINGDTVPDLLVGASSQDVGGDLDLGQAFVFSGTDGSLLLTLDNPNPPQIFSARFGEDVAAAGDVNGDTVPDLLVGAPNQDVGGNFGHGQAFVFSGADGSLLLTLNNPNPNSLFVEALFGSAVAGAGDVDGDTVPDLLVGALGQNVGGVKGVGQAFVFSGADGSLLLTLNNPVLQEVAWFGGAVAAAGDVDGDTVPDLLVGAPSQRIGPNEVGQAFVFSGVDGSLLRTLDDPTPQHNAFFGTAVAGVGDVNSDTVPDLLVGVLNQDVGGNLDQGQAFVFSGADGSLLHTLDDPTPQSGASFGIAVAAAGDVNGDTVPDLLVGARGQDVGGNSRQGQAFLFVSVLDLVVDADFEIHPGSDIAPINLKSNGVIPTVVFTTGELDATTIDISTVEFGPALASEAHGSLHLEDVNGDGLLDAVMHFRTQESGIMPGDTEACISGTTTGGATFSACDEIVTKP